MKRSSGAATQPVERRRNDDGKGWGIGEGASIRHRRHDEIVCAGGPVVGESGGGVWWRDKVKPPRWANRGGSRGGKGARLVRLSATTTLALGPPLCTGSGDGHPQDVTRSSR